MAATTPNKFMTEQVYLAIDLGAESGRVMAGLWNGATMQLEQVHRFANEPVEIGESLRWDVPRLWLEIQNGLSLAARRFGKKVVSVGVDAWGVDFVLLSKSSEMLGLPHHYRDGRTSGWVEAACRQVPRAEIFAETGLQFMEINTLCQLLALRKASPELLAAPDSLLMIPDYLHWCLSGEQTCEFTNATTTQCFHPVNRTWSRGLLEKFNLPTRMFKEVVPPGTRLGSLRASLAQRTGLDPAVAVIAPATHDTASAVVAVPAAHTGRNNWAYISSGTWSLMGLEIPRAQLSQRVLELNFTNEGGVDGTFRLLKKIMGLWLVQQCKRSFENRGGTMDYAGLAALAETEPALRSIVVPNDQRFLHPPDMPAAIQDFCRETGQPVPESEGALVRCALESLALAYQRVLCGLEEINNGPIETIHIVGGGSRNDLLNQFTANACGRRVLAGLVEATALGNLLIQMRACGGVGSLAEIRSIVARSCELREFTPQSVDATAWQEAKGRFAKLKK